MKEKIKFVFVSNYLNHHQLPFCNAMYEILEGSFAFIQTEPMEEERVSMGWNQNISCPYLRLYYESPEECKNLISEASVVMFGGCEDESYIEERLGAGKPVIRDSERLYKTGQWKAVSPRGLRKKYHDHTKYRKAPVYLLCAGAYVASDFHIVRAYPGKMYCWGYFPEAKRYDVDKLMEQKGWLCEDGSCIPHLLWAARMIDWKHPELALETAHYLKERGLKFHMDIIGGGALSEQMEVLQRQYKLEDCVTFTGFMPPEKVRTYMEKADIFLFTSDRQEGWGAVANEAMNSGCALVADHMIGAVPYLVRQNENGLIYRSGRKKELFEMTEMLVRKKELRQRLGRKAYETIITTWNAESASKRLLALCVKLELLKKEDFGQMNMEAVSAAVAKPETYGGLAPCVPAPVLSEKFPKDIRGIKVEEE